VQAVCSAQQQTSTVDYRSPSSTSGHQTTVTSTVDCCCCFAVGLSALYHSNSVATQMLSLSTLQSCACCHHPLNASGASLQAKCDPNSQKCDLHRPQCDLTVPSVTSTDELSDHGCLSRPQCDLAVQSVTSTEGHIQHITLQCSDHTAGTHAGITRAQHTTKCSDHTTVTCGGMQLRWQQLQTATAARVTGQVSAPQHELRRAGSIRRIHKSSRCHTGLDTKPAVTEAGKTTARRACQPKGWG
jgi:hypothetical protein